MFSFKKSFVIMFTAILFYSKIFTGCSTSNTHLPTPTPNLYNSPNSNSLLSSMSAEEENYTPESPLPPSTISPLVEQSLPEENSKDNVSEVFEEINDSAPTLPHVSSLAIDALSTREENSKEDNVSNVLLMELSSTSLDLSSIPEFIEIKITNISKNEYIGSYHYSIERYEDDTWNSIVIPGVVDEGLIIFPGETLEFRAIQLQPHKYSYSAGRYRVNFNRCCFGEFTIIDD